MTLQRRLGTMPFVWEETVMKSAIAAETMLISSACCPSRRAGDHRQ